MVNRGRGGATLYLRRASPSPFSCSCRWPAAPAWLATDWAALPAIVWITLAYIVVFATMVSSYLLAFASLRLPAAKVMAYTLSHARPGSFSGNSPSVIGGPPALVLGARGADHGGALASAEGRGRARRSWAS